MQEDFKMDVPIRDIVADPNQPRKHFDETKLGELAHSISQYGVIQPILLRPIKSKNKGKYMIVSGERRWRATQLAALDVIPAVIRVLTDIEALEVQITENLQREDVNAMEEAEAFQNIIKGGIYKTKELAARLGKRKEYILQRLKLCELIAEFQDLVYADKILMTQANQICKFSADVQKDFYHSYVPEDWKEMPDGWKLREIHFGNTTHNLDEATFKTEDPTLNPKMGACGQCRFNSKVSELDFEGHENKRICSNPSCYETKTKNSYQRHLAEVAKDESVLLVASHIYGDTSKAKVAAAEATGKPVLPEGTWKILEEPKMPEKPAFEDFKKEYEIENEDDLDALANVDEAWKETLQDYQEEMLQWQDKVADYRSKSLKAQKAFVVTGWKKEGQIIDVYVPENIDTATISTKKQIEELRQRDKRTEELAGQKYFKDVHQTLAESPRFVDREGAFESSELEMLFAVLLQVSDRKITDDIKKDIEKEKLTDPQLLQHLIANSAPGFLYMWVRRMALRKLSQINLEYQHDAYKCSSLVFQRLADRFVPHEHASIIAEKNKKREAQKAKLNEKITDLQQTKIEAA